MRIFGFSLLAVLALFGCNKSEDAGGGAAGAAGKTYRIAVIPKGTTHEFWKSVHYGAEKAAKELGNIEIIWKGPLKEDDREGQINIVQDLITQQVDGIVLAPLDSRALVPAVKEAKQEGIPTVIFDSGLNDEEIIVSYVATDNYNGGALAAREMGRLLNGQGDVIMLRYRPGSESTEQRESGFLETLAQEFPNIQMLVSDEYAGTTRDASLEKAEQLLPKYKAEVDGIFAVCEPNAFGVLGALKDKELAMAGKVKFIGFDPSPEMVAALQERHMHGIVLQDPVTMGYEAVKTMAAHLAGEEVKKRVNTGEHIATPDNMNEPQIHKLLHPEQFAE